MCGIVGFWHCNNSAVGQDDLAVLKRMADTLTHRGPDSEGFWAAESNDVFMAHRRLSIIDLSDSGLQPMRSKSGRFTLVFNGEIYNFRTIKSNLERRHSVTWQGRSDTEVLLACIELMGLEYTLSEAVGMFAFALWDNEKRTLQLVRDRFGEKPLYWGFVGGSLCFSSELKALKQYPKFSKKIDKSALSHFMSYGYISKSSSIYEGIRKVRAGTVVTIPEVGKVDESVYWSARDVALKASQNLFVGSEVAAIDRLEELLCQSIRDQLIADVPVGTFLSGGIDSSLISALAQRETGNPIDTFSIGFYEKEFNEAPYAAEVARAIGSRHHESYVSEKDLLDVVPLLPTLYDEPFGDPSQIPTYLVCKLARSKVAVSLSGDAGDELFCGYNRYTMAYLFWKRFGSIPFAARSMLIRCMSAVPFRCWDAFVKLLNGHNHLTADKLLKLFGLIGSSKNLPQTYDALNFHWSIKDKLVQGSSHLSFIEEDWQNILHELQAMMLLDTENYLTDDILVKVDRASMGVSLESRVPMLDHRIYEFAWSLPLNMRMRGREGKWILRQLLYRYVPRALVDRPKAGFAAPIGTWLRGPLKEWAEFLLDETQLRDQGYLNVSLVRKTWQEHQSGMRNWQYRLWNVLMFQAWLAKEG